MGGAVPGLGEFQLKAGRVPLLPPVMSFLHTPEPHISVSTSVQAPYALYANMEQNGEFKSATVCLIPLLLSHQRRQSQPPFSHKTSPLQSMLWRKMGLGRDAQSPRTRLEMVTNGEENDTVYGHGISLQIYVFDRMVMVLRF